MAHPYNERLRGTGTHLPMEELQEQLAEIVEFAAEQLDLVEAMANEDEDDEDVETMDGCGGRRRCGG